MWKDRRVRLLFLLRTSISSTITRHGYLRLNVSLLPRGLTPVSPRPGRSGKSTNAGELKAVFPKPPLFFRLPPQWFGILDRKSTRLNSSHVRISYAVFCLKLKDRMPVALNQAEHAIW